MSLPLAEQITDQTKIRFRFVFDGGREDSVVEVPWTAENVGAKGSSVRSAGDGTILKFEGASVQGGVMEYRFVETT